MKLVPTFRALAGALSIAAALAACSDVLGGGDTLPVSFTNTAPPPPQGPVNFSAASTAPGTLTIDGAYTYGGCDTPKYTARVDGSELVFRLTLNHHSDKICPAFIAVSGYRAEITGVPAGGYHVRVEHAGMYEVGGFVGDGVHLETDVTVQ